MHARAAARKVVIVSSSRVESLSGLGIAATSGFTPHDSQVHLLQFAIQWNIAPDPRAIVRLTSRFRGAVLRELLELKTGATLAAWPRVDTHVRDAIADMAGKDRNNEPLKGHRHTEFLVWCDSDQPTRLLVWRHARAFDVDEREALLIAARHEVSWAEAGIDAEDQKVSLVALDRDVLPPPGFAGESSLVWESVTPYVPPRHNLRGGKERTGESTVAQIRRELAQRGISQNVEVDHFGPPHVGSGAYPSTRCQPANIRRWPPRANGTAAVYSGRCWPDSLGAFKQLWTWPLSTCHGATPAVTPPPAPGSHVEFLRFINTAIRRETPAMRHRALNVRHRMPHLRCAAGHVRCIRERAHRAFLAPCPQFLSPLIDGQICFGATILGFGRTREGVS
jgi:hypothetical protein